MQRRGRPQDQKECEACGCRVALKNWEQHAHGKRHRENMEPMRKMRKRMNPDVDPNIDVAEMNAAIVEWRTLRLDEEAKMMEVLHSRSSAPLHVPLAEGPRFVIDELIARARTFVLSEWEGLPDTCIDVNPFLQDARTPAVVRFITAYMRLKGAIKEAPLSMRQPAASSSAPSVTASSSSAAPAFKAPRILSTKDVQAQGVFAWHGSNVATNFASIFFHGWDPKRRTRQAHGQGEYFGVDHDNTLYYSSGTKRLIVAFLLKGQHLEYVNGHCYIVSNPPLETNVSFCLPVLDIMVPAGTLPSHNIHPRRWNFSWETDKRSYQLYDEATHQFLTDKYAKWLNGLSGPLVTTPRVPRKDGMGFSNYRINFGSRLQTHSLTGYERKLKIDPVPSSPLFCLWFYCRDDGEFAPFFVHVVESVMSAYIAYTEGQPGWGPTVDYNIRKCKYRADFRTMLQTNIETGTSRQLFFV